MQSYLPRVRYIKDKDNNWNKYDSLPGNVIIRQNKDVLDPCRDKEANDQAGRTHKMLTPQISRPLKQIRIYWQWQ